jgi:hypothetical protein
VRRNISDMTKIAGGLQKSSHFRPLQLNRCSPAMMHPAADTFFADENRR